MYLGGSGNRCQLKTSQALTSGPYTACLKTTQAISMTGYKRFGSSKPNSDWPSRCRIGSAEGMTCAIVSGYHNGEDCYFQTNADGFLYTLDGWSFTNSGDGINLLGTWYNSNVPRNVEVPSGTPFHFHSDGGHWNGQVTICFSSVAYETLPTPTPPTPAPPSLERHLVFVGAGMCRAGGQRLDLYQKGGLTLEDCKQTCLDNPPCVGMDMYSTFCTLWVDDGMQISSLPNTWNLYDQYSGKAPIDGYAATQNAECWKLSETLPTA